MEKPVTIPMNKLIAMILVALNSEPSINFKDSKKSRNKSKIKKRSIQPVSK